MLDGDDSEILGEFLFDIFWCVIQIQPARIMHYGARIWARVSKATLPPGTVRVTNRGNDINIDISEIYTILDYPTKVSNYFFRISYGAKR